MPRRTPGIGRSIDLKKHKALREDIQSGSVRSRQNEKPIPLGKATADLVASGKLRA